MSDPLPAPAIVEVPAPTAAEIEDVLGLREILEVGAARAAACRSSGANREKAAVMGTKLRAMKMLER